MIACLESVSFRDLVPTIRDTAYLTHGLLYYPAKFIPQVPRFCLERYTEVGDWVLDPFAGSGTVGLEAALTNRNAILLDINPILNYIVPVKMLYSYCDLNMQTVEHLLNTMFQNSTLYYRPSWDNIEYWYEDRILDRLCRWWGWVKDLDDQFYRPVLEVALLKASKHFSNAEHRVPKLFRSKRKSEFLDKFLSSDWEVAMRKFVYDTAMDACRRLIQLAHLRAKGMGHVIYYGGIDSSDASVWNNLQLPVEQVKAVITSPPYLQAQEYIRTTKLELYWLGYSHHDIQQLSRLEIPYRPAKEILSTPSLNHLREQIQTLHLRNVLDSYFYYTISAIENAVRYLAPDGVLCIFVGSPKINGITVEIWRILTEYFISRGWEQEALYEDVIKNRQLFKGRKNKNPDGMTCEFLLIMRRR